MAVIYIGSDHAGFELKACLCEHLQKQGQQVVDLGPDQPIRTDYPDSAKKVCEQVLADPQALGILICGSGLGMSMAANRYPAIRAALCSLEYHARLSRLHNNANVLCLGERVTGQGLALDIVDVFLNTDFEGGRHAERLAKFSV